MISASHEVIVVGAGPAGLASAIALRQAGLDAVCAGPAPQPDRRTTALLTGSVRFLKSIGVWPALAPEAAPLRALRLIDRTGRILRAPDMVFDAAEIGEEAFGYNVPNMAILKVMTETLGTAFFATDGVVSVEPGPQRVKLHLADGATLDAKLAVGADGRNSICRESAGIGVRSWSYDQTALVCNLSHSRPHGGACTEFHYAGGPLTVVPLPGEASSLVWVERSAAAKTLTGLSEAALTNALSERLNGLIGTVTELGPRGVFPLSGLIAKRLTGPRIALVGEAAHVMPPIGAQGLNLGFRDVADLVRCISGADDPGSPGCLARYENARRGDVLSRTFAADFLNRTLISANPLLQLARGAGLMALSMPGPLRRAAMRRGMATA
ncbi:MAG: FAD-binding protein [Rhodomicrobium sp.]|nr:FAD-binding protein [Rhodomicrobium sp.]